MGNLTGFKNHLSGAGVGRIPGNSGEPSRVGQGMGVPKTPMSVGKVPRSVSGGRSYGIRHPNTPKVGPITTKVAPEDNVASVPKAPKMPKLGTQI